MLSWFEKRINPFPDYPPDRPPYGLLAFCFHYTKGVWFWLTVMAIMTSIVAVLEVSLFGFLGTIVDWLTSSSPDTFFQREGWKLAAIGAVVLIGLPSAAALNDIIMHQTLLGNYPMRIRWLAHRYLLGQSMAYFQNEFSGRISASLMQTSLAVRETVMKLLNVLNFIIVYFIGTLVIAASSDWRLVIPFLVWLSLYIYILCYFIPRLRSASKIQADARSLMTGRVVDAYANISTVKLFSSNGREENFARDGFQEFQVTVNNQMRLVSKFSISVYFSNCLLLAAVGGLGMFLWQQNAIVVGAVAVGISLVLRLNGMAQWIMWEMSALFENIGIVEDGMRSLSKKRMIEDKPNAKPLIICKGTIRYENVFFNYAKGNPVIENLNLEIKHGQKVGIVGRSGAGKSTLVNLLLRFYDVEKGRILIDGQNIADVTQESLRAHISMVTQDTALLHRTLRENILYGRPTANDEEMWQAISDADAASFVDALQDQDGNRGLDAHVGERGARLSGGQRQRIAISRVMLKNAPILILDEATSALDSEAESVIQENLTKLMQGKTVLAIAHRLSTIRQMDRLIVMDQGKIVEDGKHEELLKRGGIYTSLWNLQVGGHLAANAMIA